MMSRTFLLATSIIALCAGGVSAAPAARAGSPGGDLPFRVSKNPKFLWNQNSNYAGNGVSSMNWTSCCTSYADQAADDFVIPRGKKWTITEVDVTGAFFTGGGPPESENVFFYKNGNGTPGNPIKMGTYSGLNGSVTSGDFSITLPNGGLTLKAGHYWLSVVANMQASCCGEWGWYANSVQHGNRAVWRNPLGGQSVGCQTWDTIENCFGFGPDLMFDLKGTSKRG
jgi:hypothetical protein